MNGGTPSPLIISSKPCHWIDPGAAEPPSAAPFLRIVRLGRPCAGEFGAQVEDCACASGYDATKCRCTIRACLQAPGRGDRRTRYRNALFQSIAEWALIVGALSLFLGSGLSAREGAQSRAALRYGFPKVGTCYVTRVKRGYEPVWRSARRRARFRGDPRK